MRKVIFVAIAVFLFAPTAWACWCPPDTYTFNVTLVDSDTQDMTRSKGGDNSEGLLGFDDWYVWTYKVAVVDEVPDGVTEVPSWAYLKHWVLELPICYLSSPDLFREIEASAGWGRKWFASVYDPDAVDPDEGETGLSGLRWSYEYGWWLSEWGLHHYYFWFSAPTNVASNTNWGVKAGDLCGGYSATVAGTVPGPGCLVPEPMSFLLMSTGIAGIFIRNRKRKG